MSIERPTEQKKHIDDLRQEILDFIARDQSTGKSGHFLSADEMFISPEDRVGYLTDDDVRAFEKYYKHFLNVIEDDAELPVGPEEIRKILDDFARERLVVSSSEIDPGRVSRGDLWMFLANKLNKLEYKLYLLEHRDKATAHKKK